MVSNFHLPPAGFGPGSQPDPADGEDLTYMDMPTGMNTYSPRIPEIEDPAALAPALAILDRVADAAERVSRTGRPESFDLAGLDAANLHLVAEVLREGEVSMKIRGLPALRVQEGVFAGIWRVRGAGEDRIEVGPVPAIAVHRAFEPLRPRRDPEPGQGVVNAPPIWSELADKSAGFDGTLHVVNLTLLPHTESDLAWLDAKMGEGSADILSRGYGNCRIRATALAHVWRVQFYNSQDQLILDTFEVTDMPEVVLAAPEDLSDSAKRLRDVLGAVR
ncbi:hydrogenase expression/formation protein [Pararhodobacter marinus]|uniref:Hydrogenase expression/formation protein n=1 Tax=Pararhodobacter marinus TaxID=2184063 RepID=A0A2U2CET3_9RHOB|nr:hydrogenase expression/formation protein [Pararhodobacter marinus]PWE30370.1 hydrogenase expression/formation protein [Pararhodobacter marinus]